MPTCHCTLLKWPACVERVLINRRFALPLGDAPEINCDNPSCGKPFHRRCLVEWLNSGGCARGAVAGQGRQAQLAVFVGATAGTFLAFCTQAVPRFACCTPACRPLPRHRHRSLLHLLLAPCRHQHAAVLQHALWQLPVLLLPYHGQSCVRQPWAGSARQQLPRTAAAECHPTVASTGGCNCAARQFAFKLRPQGQRKGSGRPSGATLSGC